VAGDVEGVLADVLAESGEGIDQDILEAGAELTTDTVNETLAGLMELYALGQLDDAERAAQCAEAVRMTPRREERIRKFVVRMARKNPERAAKFFAALLYYDPGVYVVGVARQFVAVGKAGKKRRAAVAPSVNSPAPAVSPAAAMPDVTGPGATPAVPTPTPQTSTSASGTPIPPTRPIPPHLVAFPKGENKP
jgi:hypothetical protein